MNNAIYIAQNSKDMFDIDIPSLDKGNVSTSVETPLDDDLPSELGFVASKTLTSFGVTAICIVVFIIFALLLRKKKPIEEEYAPLPEISEEQTRRKNDSEYTTEEEESIQSHLYRNNAKKRSSLSTPTSINKCIRAFLENTKEN